MVVAVTVANRWALVVIVSVAGCWFLLPAAVTSVQSLLLSLVADQLLVSVSCYSPWLLYLLLHSPITVIGGSLLLAVTGSCQHPVTSHCNFCLSLTLVNGGFYCYSWYCPCDSSRSLKPVTVTFNVVGRCNFSWLLSIVTVSGCCLSLSQVFAIAVGGPYR